MRSSAIWATISSTTLISTNVKRLGYADAQGIAKDILSRFDAGEFDVATLFYSKFQNVVSQIPTAQQIIPFEVPADYEAGRHAV